MKLHYRHTYIASYLGYVTQAIINNLPALLFLTFQKEFGITIERISLLIAINFGIQIFVDFFAARYVDRIGYRVCIVAAHLLSFLGLVCLGILPGAMRDAYTGILVAMALNAIGGGLIEVLISPIVEALPSDEKSSAMSLLHSFYCWGHVAVVLLSTGYFILFGVNQWHILPLIWALLPLANAALFCFVPLGQLTSEGEGMPMRKLFISPIFWLFLVLMICSGASEQAMSQWASLFAESGLKVSKTAGDLLGPCAFATLMGLSRLLYGIYGAKLKLRKVVALSGVLCLCSYLVAVFALSPVLALMGCAICGLSVGVMWPGAFSLASARYPQGGTAMFGLLALAGDVGCMAGPSLVGVVTGATGRMQNGLFAAIIFPIGLLIMLMLEQRKKRARA